MLQQKREDLKTSLLLATGMWTELALLQAVRQSKTLLILVVLKLVLLVGIAGLLWYFG